MSYHAVLVFPDDNERTLKQVLTRTLTGEIISSPMEDLLLICSSETDAVFIRCGLGLRPASKTSLLVPMNSRRAVASRLLRNGLTLRCEWATLENFEFFSAAAADRAIDVFTEIVGREPYSLPLDLWPDVFRPNLRVPHAATSRSSAP